MINQFKKMDSGLDPNVFKVYRILLTSIHFYYLCAEMINKLARHSWEKHSWN